MGKSITEKKSFLLKAPPVILIEMEHRSTPMVRLLILIHKKIITSHQMESLKLASYGNLGLTLIPFYLMGMLYKPSTVMVGIGVRIGIGPVVQIICTSVLMENNTLKSTK